MFADMAAAAKETANFSRTMAVAAETLDSVYGRAARARKPG
jgi:hypothetical protein